MLSESERVPTILSLPCSPYHALTGSYRPTMLSEQGPVFIALLKTRTAINTGPCTVSLLGAAGVVVVVKESRFYIKILL